MNTHAPALALLDVNETLSDLTGMTRTFTVLVAVHPWDVNGAHLAGLRTVWVDRLGTP